MLLQCKKAAMDSVTAERVMTGKNDQLLGIACRNILNLRYQFILGLTVTIRFDPGFVKRMYPPLAVEQDHGYIRAQADLYRTGTTIFWIILRITLADKIYIELLPDHGIITTAAAILPVVVTRDHVYFGRGALRN